ncbi:hypothetical protein ABEB36_006828 [Hypothenemus hampei]|uniref:Chitin-binding type-2 domain-containing protein n=1 Tax=Hypothenemus hampei TaxID=57062 RepID=A0ABD1ERX3_HYPHA
MKTTIYWICICAATTSTMGLPQSQGATAGLPGYTQLQLGQIRYLQNNKGFGATHKSFRPTTVAYEESDEYEDNLDNSPESSQDRQPTYAYATATPKTAYYASVTPKGYVKSVPQQQQQQPRRVGEKGGNRLEEEEKEEEEPDRLTLLLPQSKFQCTGKKTGYYADEDLGCEVFHYCNDNARHSWICPEGFTFHQIQLICMPPSGDNICEKSSDYHFVNDYLYKPLNLEEYQQRPNTSLRYSDRYFPESYRPRYDEDEDRPIQRQHSVRVTKYQAVPVQSTTFRPQAQVGQVFRTPEEINISLQQRRPQQYTTAKYVDVYDN